jgi:hypothetical protein
MIEISSVAAFCVAQTEPSLLNKVVKVDLFSFLELLSSINENIYLVQSINWLSTIQLKGLYLLDVAKVRRG